MITAAKFKKATGHAPKDDDLERCNCPRAGEIGHASCGWDHDMGQPEFIAQAIRLKEQIALQRGEYRCSEAPC